MQTRTQSISHVSLPELQAIVGDEHARPAVIDDRIGCRAAGLVVEPGSVAEASAVMALASRRGWHVAPRGHGSKLRWGGHLSDLDLIVSTARLDRILEHAADDLIVRVEAGVALDALQSIVAPAGQMLALNPPDASCTVGGVVAANAYGFRRQHYGTVRDLIIGITVVLADGTVARAGGKVVKNVAGYDLAKLFTGSLGTLGLIVETVFRLHPLAAARRTIAVELQQPETAIQVLHALHDSRIPFVLDALELRWTALGGQMAVLLEGTEPGVEAQKVRLLALLAPIAPAEVVAPDGEDAFWAIFTRRPWDGAAVGDSWVALGLKIAVPPGAVGPVLQSMLAIAKGSGASFEILAHAGVGVLFLGVRHSTAGKLVGLVQDMRSCVTVLGGSLVVLQAPDDVAASIDVWGPVGDAMPLMQRIKSQFDPLGLLNPGRFVGGI